MNFSSHYPSTAFRRAIKALVLVFVLVPVLTLCCYAYEAQEDIYIPPQDTQEHPCHFYATQKFIKAVTLQQKRTGYAPSVKMAQTFADLLISPPSLVHALAVLDSVIKIPPPSYFLKNQALLI